MILNNTNIASNGLSCQEHTKTRYYICSYLYLLKIMIFVFGFEIDILPYIWRWITKLITEIEYPGKISLKICIALVSNSICFHILYLKIDLLTLKMILNHHNILRKWFSCHTHIKKSYYTYSQLYLLNTGMQQSWSTNGGGHLGFMENSYLSTNWIFNMYSCC